MHPASTSPLLAGRAARASIGSAGFALVGGDGLREPFLNLGVGSESPEGRPDWDARRGDDARDPPGSRAPSSMPTCGRAYQTPNSPHYLLSPSLYLTGCFRFRISRTHLSWDFRKNRLKSFRAFQ